MACFGSFLRRPGPAGNMTCSDADTCDNCMQAGNCVFCQQDQTCHSVGSGYYPCNVCEDKGATCFRWTCDASAESVFYVLIPIGVALPLCFGVFYCWYVPRDALLVSVGVLRCCVNSDYSSLVSAMCFFFLDMWCAALAREHVCGAGKGSKGDATSPSKSVPFAMAKYFYTNLDAPVAGVVVSH